MIEEDEQTSSLDINDDWVFPNVDNFDDSLFSNEYQADSGKGRPDPLQMEKDRYEVLNAELAQSKTEYESKIVLLQNILTQLKASTAVNDESLADIIDSIIKKMVKKLIYKEIDADPALMANVISELKKVLQAKKSLINVYLCESDFNRFETDKLKPSTVINMDPSLSKGDVIIKSTTAEIWAILDERIEKLMT